MRNFLSSLFVFFAIFSILLATTGCMSVREIESGAKWDNNALFLIKAGETTAKEIAYGFGSPQKEIAGTTGRIWVYYNDSVKYLYEGNIRRGTIEAEHYSLVIWFDNHGIVTNCDLSYTEHSNPDLKKVADKVQKRQQKGVTP